MTDPARIPPYLVDDLQDITAPAAPPPEPRRPWWRRAAGWLRPYAERALALVLESRLRPRP